MRSSHSITNPVDAGFPRLQLYFIQPKTAILLFLTQTAEVQHLTIPECGMNARE
jgi:hypothetical protein